MARISRIRAMFLIPFASIFFLLGWIAFYIGSIGSYQKVLAKPLNNLQNIITLENQQIIAIPNLQKQPISQSILPPKK